MRMLDLIELKQKGIELNYKQLDYLINAYVNKEIPDYQMSAFLMAVYFKGMTKEESCNLALIMAKSGDMLDLSMIKGIKVDKHSTGGVGDKTSMIIGSLLACVGVKFAKMSGRGLGHTGGTIDKLESIKGFNTSLTTDEFINQVNDIGMAIIGQTASLAPADKLLYALRDVTSTVSSIPLIASSIMSKKLASGADAICLDVKVGNGAFMKTVEEATTLATLMCEIGELANKKMTAILTNMDAPLGYAIGNSLEIIEVINTLKGNGPSDLVEECTHIAAYLALDALVFDNYDIALKEISKLLYNDKAYNKFIEFVSSQGGDISYIKDTSKFKSAKYIIPVISENSGYVSSLNAYEIGTSAMHLGGGRFTKEDVIDFSVGIILNKKLGDYVNVGDTLAYIHSNKEQILDIVDKVAKSYLFSSEKVENDIILKVIR